MVATKRWQPKNYMQKVKNAKLIWVPTKMATKSISDTTEALIKREWVENIKYNTNKSNTNHTKVMHFIPVVWSQLI